jgi:hypothetical protein
MSAVSVALVVGARESRAQGEEPQLVSGLKGRPCRMVTHGNPCGCRQEGNEGKGSGRRPPCAVNAAGTVTTGGMRRRAARYRALSLPTADAAHSAAPLTSMACVPSMWHSLEVKVLFPAGWRRRESAAQGRRRETGSEGSVEHTRGLMDKNQRGGVTHPGTSGHGTTKSSIHQRGRCVNLAALRGRRCH